MELIEYIRIFRKWLWLLVLAAILGGGVSYLIRSRQPALYEATVLIEVGGFMQSPNPESSEIRTGVELAQTYVVLAKTHNVLQASIDAGDFPLTAQELEKIIDARTITGTSLLKITATYTEPILTADIANAVAQQLILKSPTHLTTDQQQQVALITAEIARLSTQLEAARQRLEDIDAQLRTATDAGLIADLRAQRSVAVTEVNETSATLAQFTSTIAELQARVNSLDIVQEARIPEEPVGPGLLTFVALGSITSACLAAGGILLLDYLDDTIKTPEAVVQHLQLPVLGKITNYGRGFGPANGHLITKTDPDHFVAEEYRALRTQLLYAAGGESRDLHTIFTSTAPDEGKSVTVANLAVTLALAHYQVLLIDADLRRPSQHQLFSLDNQLGLTTLLELPPEKALQNLDQLKFHKEFEGCIQQTDVPGLRLITSGILPTNPTEALGSHHLQRWLEVFRESPEIDVILVDTPPVMAVTDASVLAASTGLPIVLVLRAGKTRRAAVVESKAQLAQLGLKLRGVVLNGVKHTDLPYDRGYYNYYYGVRDKTIPTRTTVDVVRSEETSPNNGKLTQKQFKTGQLRRLPLVEASEIAALATNEIMLMTEGDKPPLVLNVTEKVTLGREHVGLEAYEAFRLGVSRSHAAIHQRGGRFYVEDLGSTNGTWLNERALRPHRSYRLANGDCVRLGELQLWVYYRTAETAEVAKA